MSIQNDIAQKAEEWLNANVASVQVFKPKREADHSKGPNDVAITYTDPIPNEEFSSAGNPPRVAFEFELGLTAYARDNLASVQNVLSSRAEIIAEAITSNTDWWQFGGSSFNATYKGYEDLREDDSTPAVKVKFQVYYRVRENAPTTVSG